MMIRSLVPIVPFACLLFPTVTPDRKFDYQSQVGTIELSPDGGGCLTIQDASLKEGASVNVILIDRPQAHTSAVIGKKLAKACPHNTDPDPADSSYQLRVPLKQAEKGPVAFGIAKFSGTFQLRDGLTRADLNEDGIEDSFRSCTSREGVHLTIWKGEPLKGSRKWHRYYFLGFDIEPDCTEKDY